MLSAFPLALAQLGDPRVRRVLVKSLLVSLAVFLGLATLAMLALDALYTTERACQLFGCPNETTRSHIGFAVWAAILIVGIWFLFPAVAIAVLGIFADEVVEAVEARHYPAAAAAAHAPNMAQGALIGLKSGGRILLWNLLAAPFYLLLLFTAIGPLILFTAVNALALGRDLGEMVAVRHLRGEALAAWLAATRGRRALLGLAATGLFLVPFVNLLAPVLGAAMATHIFHKERA